MEAFEGWRSLHHMDDANSPPKRQDNSLCLRYPRALLLGEHSAAVAPNWPVPAPRYRSLRPHSGLLSRLLSDDDFLAQ